MSAADLSPGLWVLAALGAFAVGFAKSGIPGFGLLFVAIFAAVFPARESTGLVLPMLLFGDILAIRSYRAHTQWAILRRLLPWTLGGIVLGWWALQHIDNRQAKILIGLILLSMIALHFIRRALQKRSAADPSAPPAPGHWSADGLTGTTIGFATMTANAAGPVTTIYFIARRLPKYEFLGTAAWFYFIVNVVKVPFSVQLGFVTAESLKVNAALAIFIVLGSLAGRWVVRRVRQEWFEWTALFLTAAAAANLLRELLPG